MEALQTMGASGQMQLASTVLGFAGQWKEGNEAKAAANFRASQLEQQAGQSRAAAQREAIEKRRQANLAGSRLQALAGGDAVELAVGIAGEGEYRALSSLYEGENRAVGLEQAAEAERYSGSQRQRSARFGAITGALGKGATMYDKYWPKTNLSFGAPPSGAVAHNGTPTGYR